MPAKDIFHDMVKIGLEKERWEITPDPIELVKQGVPKQDIVIGFHSPFMRKFTEYAVG